MLSSGIRPEQSSKIPIQIWSHKRKLSTLVPRTLALPGNLVASPSLQRGQVDRLPTNVSRPEERLRAGGAAHCATIRTRRLIAATPQYLALSTLCSWPSSGPNGHAAQGWTPLSDGILSHRHQTSPESSARQQTGGKNGRQLLWHAFNAELGKPR